MERSHTHIQLLLRKETPHHYLTFHTSFHYLTYLHSCQGSDESESKKIFYEGAGACYPEILISRSSVVCFGVFSITVSVNHLPKFH